jgi:hypothetical protein
MFSTQLCFFRSTYLPITHVQGVRSSLCLSIASTASSQNSKHLFFDRPPSPQQWPQYFLDLLNIHNYLTFVHTTMASEQQQEETASPTPVEEATDDVEKLSVSSDKNNGTTATEVIAADKASALEDNIAKKGKNAYYYAHDKQKQTHVFKWDGKPEPALIGREKSNDDLPLATKFKKSQSFNYAASNITSYAFLNEDKVVKLYITMEEVGDKCTDEDIQLDWDESSLSLTVKNYKKDDDTNTNPDQCLSFGKLTANITDAQYKLKKDKIILTLRKEQQGVEWHTINDKGTPDHEVV